MTERELRELLRGAPLDLDPGSEQRAWRIVAGAYRPQPGPRLQRRARRAIAVFACLALAAMLALAGAAAPRQAVARWLREAFGLSAQPRPVRVLGGLPGGGRLLVEAADGPWLVAADGSRRYLGGYAGAAWSPHSRYVVAWRGPELAALDLAGRRQWALAAPGAVTAARWSPDGYRIAFLAAGTLRVVAGDGSDTRTLRGDAAAVPPAWQPGTGTLHRLAFVTRGGAVEELDADRGARLWRVRPAVAAHRLLWSPDGRRLLVVGVHQLAEYDSSGRLVATVAPAPGATLGGVAFVSSDRFALLDHAGPGRPDGVVLLHLGPRPAPVILYTGIERLSGLDASPRHAWLLAASPSADQWIFIRVGVPARLLATNGIASRFQRRGARAAARFPRLAGWQR